MPHVEPDTRYQIHLAIAESDEVNAAESSHATRTNPTDPTDHRFPTLASQLERIPKDAKSLYIDKDVPTDEEWGVLGSHFTAIEDLEVEAGFNEYLKDRCVPIHWPLKRLKIGSSCGEKIENLHVLLGKVQHLIFWLTHGIRFEGPTTNELVRIHYEAIERGEKKHHHVTENGGTLTVNQILVEDWMQNKYHDKTIVEIEANAEPNPDLHVDTDLIKQAQESDGNEIALTKFEILENDAIEEFMYFYIALPHLAHNLRHLKINSSNGCDFQSMGEAMFAPMLSRLNQLDILELTLGEVFKNDGSASMQTMQTVAGAYIALTQNTTSDVEANTEKTENVTASDTEANPTDSAPTTPAFDPLGTLYNFFPNRVRELHFRGPVSLTSRANWSDWVAKFGDETFLPNLERLSFVCDIAYDPLKEGALIRPPRKATDDEISAAREACEKLYDAVENRTGEKKVSVVPFEEEWAGSHRCFMEVDERW